MSAMDERHARLSDALVKSVSQEDALRVESLRAGEDYLGPTALMIAASQGDTAIVKSLLDHGASVTQRGTRVEDAESPATLRPPVPPLYEAIHSRQVSASLSLIQRGAPVDFRVSGLTPLMLTTQEEVAAALIPHGANVNAADTGGDTSLLLAVGNPDAPGKRTKPKRLLRECPWCACC